MPGSPPLEAGRYDEAAELFSRVIDAGGDPRVLSTALTNRGFVESRLGNWQQASDDYYEALRLQPESASAHNNFAWLLATCPIDVLRNGKQAVSHATWACEATGWKNSSCIGTLAAACAEVGDFNQAVHLQQRAVADPAYRQKYGEATVTDRLRLYERGLPFRQSADIG